MEKCPKPSESTMACCSLNKRRITTPTVKFDNHTLAEIDQQSTGSIMSFHDIDTVDCFSFDIARSETGILLGSWVLRSTLDKFCIEGMKGSSLIQLKGSAAFNCPVFNSP